MMDDPALLDRQSAYLDTLRGLYKTERTLGFVACLVGALMLIVARFRLGGEPLLLWGGAAVVALGWGLFVYAVIRRLQWVRAHPFDPNG
jgi:hypothetical protein